MPAISQKEAARRFAKIWEGRGSETKDDRQFWLQLLMDVFRIDNPFSIIEFQKPVKMESSTKFIDGFIPSTRVLIEQKGIDIDLSKKYRQSDGAELTPYEQARRYDQYMLPDEHPHWIVVSNFKSFEIHDMNRPYDEPVVILLKDLPNEYSKLSFITDAQRLHIQHEKQVSLDAGKIVGRLYDALAKQYVNPDDEHSKHSLNVLCVRFVFCLYAEDAGVFLKDQFHDYLKDVPVEDMREAVLRLFEVLDTPVGMRSPYLKESLKAFPYTNGGLFHDRDIEVPMFTEEIKDVLVQHASDDFDWSSISPTIFGAVFESTLNPETRRGNGMHYTSIENIHKVIDPLFLDGLKEELQAAKDAPATRRRQELRNFQERISELTFLDPACGSGNFLTETYLSLRRLENDVIRELAGDNMLLDMEEDLIKVKISQLYGIEINDFAADVARTALWISEAQMMEETKNIVQKDMDFLPLKSNTNIHTGNALRMDWNEVIPAEKLDYIMGNPPFIGHQNRSEEQIEDMDIAFQGFETYGKLDYVAAWYKMAADYMQGTSILAAFVSTNSIVQGESVAVMWEPLQEKRSVEIIFTHRTFVWNSEAKDKAAVHCVIIGFCAFHYTGKKIIFDQKHGSEIAANINGYLLDAPNVFIKGRSKQLNPDLPEMTKGSQATDGGNLFLTVEEREELLAKYPSAEPLVKQFVGAEEFINNKLRYCIWLKGVAPSQYRNIPPIMERLEKVAEMRRKSPTKSVQKDADIPMLFTQIRQPETAYMIIPRHSSENRRYIPFGYMSPDVICGDANSMIPDASLVLFGMLISSVHMAWMRVVCGRLKSDYRYSPSVYNNFPWPQLSDSQKSKIESAAQAIIDAREMYQDDSLADLYAENAMPVELLKAHRANDAAVMEAYGFRKDMAEPEIVAELFKMYKELTNNKL